MPLLYVDLIEGRAPAEIRALLDGIHDAVVEAFAVPPRDRYQVVRTHPAHEIADLIVAVTDNGDDDWSFGYGRAQFLTGELK
jgi:4-oxalocrotonate tautomerase